VALAENVGMHVLTLRLRFEIYSQDVLLRQHRMRLKVGEFKSYVSHA